MTMDELNLTSFGRGQKLWFNPSLQTVGGLTEGKPITSTPCHAKVARTVSDSVCDNTDDGSGNTASPPVDQDAENVPVSVLSDLVKQIGASIGENIVSCLKSIPAGDASLTRSAIADVSRINLTVSHDSYEPHSFWGDNTDRISVTEWEESVKVYLHKRDIQLCDQAEEVLSKLRGRARDVVRVGLRSNPTLSLKSGPRPIFDILKQHFGDSVTSFMPLADFYDTKPSPHETAVDYWIRLNKAIDTAVEGLTRQGKTLDNPSREVTVMFITHCPDPELSVVFSCKPLEEWTASDVQVRLDEHHRRKRLQQRQSSHPAENLCPVQAVEVLHSHVQAAVSPPAPQPPAADGTLSNEGRSLSHVITLLERLLHQQSSLHPRPPRPRHGARPRFRGPCVICGSDNHDTVTHCRNDRLCFRCHAAGHQAITCTSAPAPGSPPVRSGVPAQQEN